MKKLLLAVINAMLFLSLPLVTTGAQETDVAKMSKDHKQAYDASLALYGNLGDESHFLCSATVVARRAALQGGDEPKGRNDYLLLTAGHCIGGANPELPEDLNYFVRRDIIAEEGSEKAAGSIPAFVYRAEFSEKYDFAVLYINTNEEFLVIDIDSSGKLPEIEQEIYSVNFTEGLVKQVAVGKVASGSIPGVHPELQDRFMVHIFGGHGASGAAVISEKTHRIVGIVEFEVQGEAAGIGCESMLKLKEWLATPITSTVSPKGKGPILTAAKW